jgi:Ca2+-binding EF-hand superfamily protein
MAPEVLKGSYTSQADLWSVGVIAYMLLSSQMPFYGRKRRHVVEQIMECRYNFDGRRWKRVSQQAKSFVEDLLVKNPDERLTAEEAAACTWLNRRYAATTRGPSKQEIDNTTTSLTAYANYHKLKKLALMVIAHKSTSEEIGILRKVFERYDTARNGSISLDEFKVALESYGYTDEEVERMFDGLDLDRTGEVKYCEFLAATIEAQGAISEERLAEAFDRLDSDDSGFISKENLREFLGDDLPQDEIDEIIREVDVNNDNKISYPEFLALWEDKNEEKRDSLMEDLRAHRATLSTSSYGSSHYGSSSHHSAYRDALKADNESDHNTLARANYIEKKKLSERRQKKLGQMESKEAKEKMFIEEDEYDFRVETPEPDMNSKDSAGHESLVVGAA